MDICCNNLSKNDQTHYVRRQETRLEKCMFGRDEVEIPEILMEDIHLFLEVMSQEMWQNVLSESQRNHLMNLLPVFSDDDDSDIKEKEETLILIFYGCIFKFGNPLKQFYRKMRNGMFSSEISKYAQMCMKAKERDYRYQQKLYYSNLLREVLVNRQGIIETFHQCPPEDTGIMKMNGICCQQLLMLHHDSLEEKVIDSCNQLVLEVNEECGLSELLSSSDEEDLITQAKCHSKQQAMKVHESYGLGIGHVQDTFAQKPSSQPLTSSAFTDGCAVRAMKYKRSFGQLGFMDLPDDQYMLMIHKHKYRKLAYKEHPDLDTSGIVLNDIIYRVQAGRNAHIQESHKKKPKKNIRLNDEEGSCQAVQQEDLLASYIDARPTAVEYVVDVFSGDVYDGSSGQCRNAKVNQRFPNFFSLIKNFVLEELQDKIMIAKLEEKIYQWQVSESVRVINHWFQDKQNWLDLLPSALRFLSDMPVEDCVPLLNFDDSAQLCYWTGDGHDSDEELSKLYRYWFLNCENISGNSDNIPPPRMWTDYKVQQTTEEEKHVFRIQERERYSNPHRAYTYRMHGYEAVVGPVKGVFVKESTIRPRDHSLLIKDRPSYVTILTLVHDGVARLPNGEGTRSQICELLKDSQFLASGVTDLQINAVVSGALDRLHYEKDPCVKFDGLRKLWIYRHRYRAEDEFERIHKVQGEDAHAKKRTMQQKHTVAKVICERANEKHHRLAQLDVDAAGASVDNDNLLTEQIISSSASHLQPVSVFTSDSSYSSSTIMTSVLTCKTTDSIAHLLSCGSKFGIPGNILNISLVQPEMSVPVCDTLLSVNSTSCNSDMKKIFIASDHTGTKEPSIVRASMQLVLSSSQCHTPNSNTMTTSTPVIARLLQPSSAFNREKITNLLTLPRATLVHGLGTKTPLLTTSSVATDVTLSLKAAAVSQQNIAASLSKTSNLQQEALVVTKNILVTSCQSSLLHTAGQLMTGHHMLRPRPLIVSGPPRTVVNAASGKTAPFVGKPVQFIQGCRNPTTHLVTAVRMTTSRIPVTGQIRASEIGPDVTSQSLLLQQYSQAPLVSQHVAVNEQNASDIHNYFKKSDQLASGQVQLRKSCQEKRAISLQVTDDTLSTMSDTLK